MALDAAHGNGEMLARPAPPSRRSPTTSACPPARLPACPPRVFGFMNDAFERDD